MYKKSIFFVLIVFFLLPNAMMAQFNTLLPKKKIEVKKENETPPPVIEEPVVVVDTTSQSQQKVEFEEVMPIAADTTSNLSIESLIGYVSLPLDTIVITSRYGKRTPPCKGASSDHKGIDLNGNKSMIKAVMAGRVKKVGNNRSLGNYIVIEHGDFVSIYGHLSSSFVLSRQYIAAGQVIGITGETGVCTGDHLHFALKYKNEYMDPEPFIVLAQKIHSCSVKQ